MVDKKWKTKWLKIIPEEDEKEAKEYLKMTMEKAVKQTMENINRQCKFCGSSNLVRNGTYNNVQRWYCRDCKRGFIDNKALPRMKHPIRMVASVLSMYMRGLSEKDIQEHLKINWEYTPTNATIFRWVQRMTKIAGDKLEQYQPKVGDTWVADETCIFIGGQKYWLFDLIDEKTRFLLATHLTPTRNISDAKTLVEKAAHKAGKAPKVIITDSLRAYIDGIELAFGSETKHIQTKGLTAEINTNIIERWHGTLKDRTRIMRGFKNVDSAITTLDGWVNHYNFLRPHESLNNKTPAEVANIDYPYKTWLDIVNSQQGIIHKPERRQLPKVKQTELIKIRKRRRRRLPRHKISPDTILRETRR
jgi:putative transposase